MITKRDNRGRFTSKLPKEAIEKIREMIKSGEETEKILLYIISHDMSLPSAYWRYKRDAESLGVKVDSFVNYLVKVWERIYLN